MKQEIDIFSIHNSANAAHPIVPSQEWAKASYVEYDEARDRSNTSLHWPTLLAYPTIQSNRHCRGLSAKGLPVLALFSLRKLRSDGSDTPPRNIESLDTYTSWFPVVAAPWPGDEPARTLCLIYRHPDVIYPETVFRSHAETVEVPSSDLRNRLVRGYPPPKTFKFLLISYFQNFYGAGAIQKSIVKLPQPTEEGRVVVQERIIFTLSRTIINMEAYRDHTKPLLRKMSPRELLR